MFGGKVLDEQAYFSSDVLDPQDILGLRYLVLGLV